MTSKPELRAFQSDAFVTYRRWWLDRLLAQSFAGWEGTVVDLGGENTTGRGSFQRPPSAKWICVNLDPGVKPDITASADAVPLPDASADGVVCTEVLEHLAQPQRCIAEAYRLLKPGGRIVASTPFLYPIHGDPDDYFRYTPSALRNQFAGFQNVRILPMGGAAGSVALLAEKTLQPWTNGSPMKRGARRAAIWGLRALCHWDARQELRREATAPLPSLTTGYFLVATKPSA